MKRAQTDDTQTLQMALVGYQIEQQKIEAKMQELRVQLGYNKPGRRPAALTDIAGVNGAEPQPTRTKRILSADARRRIAAAQKKRWAEHHKRQAEAAKEAKPKRKMSAAAKAQLAANLKKARAAKAKKAKTETAAAAPE
jgi:hypothetical protein